MDFNPPMDLSKIPSCRTWIRCQREADLEPVDLETVPVAVVVPKESVGLYRAAIVVSIPPSMRLSAAYMEYDIVVPVLIEVKEEGALAPLEPELYAVEINPEPISLKQDPNTMEPYRQYLGCRKADIRTTLPSRLAIGITPGTKPEGGSWGVTVTPAEIDGKTEVEICAAGKYEQIEKLKGGSMNIMITLIIRVIPNPSIWPVFRQDLD
jgi:hypothetical protein